MIIKPKFKTFSRFITAVLASGSIFLGITVLGQSAQTTDCNAVTKADIAFAQARSSQRRKEAYNRFQFVETRLNYVKSVGVDVSALSALRDPLKTKLKNTQTNYIAWVEATKKIDCSSEQTINTTRTARDLAHSKAWADFKDFMFYYNESVRPVFRSVANSAQTTNKTFVTQTLLPTPEPKINSSSTQNQTNNYPSSI